jgi:hypothetical protein
VLLHRGRAALATRLGADGLTIEEVHRHA